MKNKFYDVTKNEDGVFSTRSGKLIDIMNPTPDMIYLEDIAHGLSNICRFGGQVDEFYSVAQHSVIVSHLCRSEDALVGLMHDAAEAYIGDVIKPLKNLLGDVYEDIEAKFTHAIFDKYGIDARHLENIKEADDRALKAEHDYLREIDVAMLNRIVSGIDGDHYSNGAVWASRKAYEKFIRRFVRLI